MRIYDCVIISVLYGVLGVLLVNAGVEGWHFAAIMFSVLCIDIHSFSTSGKYLKKK